MDKQAITSRIIKSEPVAWRQLKYIQQEGFKEFTEQNRQKLKASLLANDFLEPFYVWHSSDGIYCLDGFHRSDLLTELSNEGVAVPDLLPANFIACNDRADAARMVLIYSSIYANVTPAGYEAFAQLNEIKPEILAEIQLPYMEVFSRPILDIPSELLDAAKDKPATLKITFQSPDHLQEAEKEISILLARWPKAFYSVSCGEI